MTLSKLNFCYSCLWAKYIFDHGRNASAHVKYWSIPFSYIVNSRILKDIKINLCNALSYRAGTISKLLRVKLLLPIFKSGSGWSVFPDITLLFVSVLEGSSLHLKYVLLYVSPLLDYLTPLFLLHWHSNV